MDPAAQQPTQNTPSSNDQPDTNQAGPANPPTQGMPTGADLERINREMYKRNLELAERNKTLSLLRRLDELILSSVTDLKETATQVTNLLVKDAEFRLAAIFLLDKEKRNLSLFSFSKSPTLTQDEQLQLDRFTMVKTFSVSIPNNLMVQAIDERKVKTTETLINVMQTGSIIGAEDAMIIQKVAGIKSTVVLPIIMRENVIGAMIVCQAYTIADLNEYQWDLLERLVAMIGIALDNALLYTEVQSTNQKLKVLDRLKDEFVSLASHELRTPMTAIRSYLWLFLEDNRKFLNDKQKTYIERAYTSTDRLINLVNDMLNVSRIESGRLIINKKSFDIVQLTNEVVSEILQTAKDEDKTIIFNPPSNIPQVDADPDKIKQVLLNLLGNSVKFTHPGGKIEISISHNDGYITVTVQDTGKGISKEDLAKLFKKFGILGSTDIITHGSQSTGLGLYISKSIVEMSGGKIWAESDGEEKGARFYFTLHVTPTPPQE